MFNKWKELIPVQSTDYAGLTWQQAADTLVQKKAGMYLLGLFVSAQFAATNDPADLADLDFFAFPALGTEFDAEKALDAPIDTIQIAAKSPEPRGEQDAAKAYLEHWAKGSTQLACVRRTSRACSRPRTTPTSPATATSSKKAVEVVGAAQRITQFLDRDTRSDFAGANGMQSFLQTFLANPMRISPSSRQTIQDFWDSLPPCPEHLTVSSGTDF